MDKNRCADLKRCISRSRRRVGWCEFSARLFLRKLCLCRADLAAVRAQPVGHQHFGCEALLLKQLAHQFHGCSLVAPSLHQEVENLAFVVNSAPEPELPAANMITAMSS